VNGTNQEDVARLGEARVHEPRVKHIGGGEEAQPEILLRDQPPPRHHGEHLSMEWKYQSQARQHPQ